MIRFPLSGGFASLLSGGSDEDLFRHVGGFASFVDGGSDEDRLESHRAPTGAERPRYVRELSIAGLALSGRPSSEILMARIELSVWEVKDGLEGSSSRTTDSRHAALDSRTGTPIYVGGRLAETLESSEAVVDGTIGAGTASRPRYRYFAKEGAGTTNREFARLGSDGSPMYLNAAGEETSDVDEARVERIWNESTKVWEDKPVFSAHYTDDVADARRLRRNEDNEMVPVYAARRTLSREHAALDDDGSPLFVRGTTTNRADAKLVDGSLVRARDGDGRFRSESRRVPLFVAAARSGGDQPRTLRVSYARYDSSGKVLYVDSADPTATTTDRSSALEDGDGNPYYAAGFTTSSSEAKRDGDRYVYAAETTDYDSALKRGGKPVYLDRRIESPQGGRAFDDGDAIFTTSLKRASTTEGSPLYANTDRVDSENLATTFERSRARGDVAYVRSGVSLAHGDEVLSSTSRDS